MADIQKVNGAHDEQAGETDALAVQASLREDELADAAADMRDSVASFTFDGDRNDVDHISGAPVERELVLGSEDPRDASLEERPLSEDVAWTGRIFNVNRLQVELPDGRHAVRDVVRQYRTALGRVTVEIPAGKLTPGEDPLEAASRELLEETGMTAEKIAFLTTIASSDGFCDELIHIYMATGLEFSKSSPDADEFINVDLVELSELVDAVLDGRIEDAKTVVGALLCDSISHRLNFSQEEE